MVHNPLTLRSQTARVECQLDAATLHVAMILRLASKIVTSRNQSPGSLQRVAIESKAVEHLHLLLVLLRLFTREFRSRVSFVHIVLRKDGEIPPVSATLLRLHFLDDAGV